MRTVDILSRARDGNIIDVAIFPDGSFAWYIANRWVLQDGTIDDVSDFIDTIQCAEGSASHRLWGSAGYVVVDAPDQRGRLRVTLTGSLTAPDLVIRLHGSEAPDLESLFWPTEIADWSDRTQGVIVITGPGSSGKSSLGAGLVRRASSQERLCWTLEAPVEFEQPSRLARPKSVGGPGRDFPTYAHGVVAAMTATVNVVFIGQANDRDTAEAAFDCARLGKLVILTMLSGNCSQSAQQLHAWGIDGRMQGELVRGIAALRLVPALGGVDRETGLSLVGACEVWTPDEDSIGALGQNRFDVIDQRLKETNHTLEDSLRHIVARERVALQEARRLAVHPEAL